MKTVNLELSKQLKESGYPQDKPTFSFIAYGKEFVGDEKMSYSNGFSSNEFNWIASPTADEILDVLPDEVEKNGTLFGLYMNKYIGDDGIAIYELYYEYVRDEVQEYFKEVLDDEWLSNVAAKMYLYLKKEGLI